MPSTFFGLDIASTGLRAYQIALNTTAHNAANEQTKGYSRQVANLQAGEALRVYSNAGMAGTGVEVSTIKQMRDSYYDVKYWSNQANLGQQSMNNYYLEQVENYFNEMNTDGFTTEYDNFFNALESLQSDPSNVTLRNQLINYGKSITDYFNTTQANLVNLQEDCNAEINNKVQEINSTAESIASITKQINTIELNGGTANDLRDQRSLLIDNLSKIVPVTVNENKGENGATTYDVKINGQSLVSTYNYNTLETVTRDEKVNSTDATGLYDIQWSNGWSFDIQSDNMSGELKAIVDIRDGNGDDFKGIPYYIKSLDSFVSTFAAKFNEIHEKGQNLNGDSTADIPFFTASDGSDTITSYNFTVNPDLIENPSLMATSYDISDGNGDGSIAKELNDLQNSVMFMGGTPKQFLQKIVSEISIDKQKAENQETNYTNIGTTIENQRTSVSGVDSDEEAMNLVKYQDAYELSAKMLSVMSEIYDKLINETGV